MNDDDLNDLKSILRQLSADPSDLDKAEEVDLAAKEILGKLHGEF
jgi:hypothetical protein